MKTNQKKATLPETADEAVEYIINHLDKNSREILMNTEFNNLLNHNRILGMRIRNELGLWRGNDALMKSCLRLRNTGEYDPDMVSLILIEEVWIALKQKHSEL